VPVTQHHNNNNSAVCLSVRSDKAQNLQKNGLKTTAVYTIGNAYSKRPCNTRINS